VCLLVAPARELIKQLTVAALPLMVTHPPLPRPGFWSLSVVWAAWLWSKQSNVVDHLLPLLSRKRTSWEWQWRAIGSALSIASAGGKARGHDFPAEKAISMASFWRSPCASRVESIVCDPLDGVRATCRAVSRHLPAQEDTLRIIFKRGEKLRWSCARAFAAWGQTAALTGSRKVRRANAAGGTAGQIDRAWSASLRITASLVVDAVTRQLRRWRSGGATRRNLLHERAE
jgi:hypothetical protein